MPWTALSSELGTLKSLHGANVLLFLNIAYFAPSLPILVAQLVRPRCCQPSLEICRLSPCFLRSFYLRASSGGNPKSSWNLLNHTNFFARTEMSHASVMYTDAALRQADCACRSGIQSSTGSSAQQKLHCSDNV